MPKIKCPKCGGTEEIYNAPGGKLIHDVKGCGHKWIEGNKTKKQRKAMKEGIQESNTNVLEGKN